MYTNIVLDKYCYKRVISSGSSQIYMHLYAYIFDVCMLTYFHVYSGAGKILLGGR